MQGSPLSVDVLTERLSTVLERVGASERHHAEQDKRIDDLERWRDETAGALSLIRFVLASSVITAILTLLTMFLTLSGHRV